MTSSSTRPFDSTWDIGHYLPIGNHLEQSLYLQSFSRQALLASKYIGVTTFWVTFQGHVTSSVTWPIDSHVAIFYRCSIVIKSLSPAVLPDNGHQTYWGHDLDLSGSRDVMVMW